MWQEKRGKSHTRYYLRRASGNKGLKEQEKMFLPGRKALKCIWCLETAEWATGCWMDMKGREEQVEMRFRTQTEDPITESCECHVGNFYFIL